MNLKVNDRRNTSLISDRPDKHAFYIIAVGNKDMENIRPTEAYLKEQKIKQSRN